MSGKVLPLYGCMGHTIAGLDQIESIGKADIFSDKKPWK